MFGNSIEKKGLKAKNGKKSAKFTLREALFLHPKSLSLERTCMFYYFL